jgi:hypothetical protein
VAGLSFTSLGYVKATAADTFAIDTTIYQPQDNGLSGLAGLAFTSGGHVKQTALDTFIIDNTVYQPALSGLTANYVTKAASASTIANGTLYDNGNIGLGTTDPIAKLVVDGAVYIGVDAYPSWSDVTAANKALYVKGSIETDGTLYVDASGDSKIGGALTIDGSLYMTNMPMATSGYVCFNSAGKFFYTKSTCP